MAFDLDEQEQIADLKVFWTRWGGLLSGLMLAGALAFAGWKGYQYYQVKQSEKAAAAYEAYAQLAQKKDAGSDAALALVQQNYGKTRYAALASVSAANAAIAAAQYDKALPPLQWLIDHGSVENQSVARLMLADVYAQTAKTDDAIKVLDVLPNPSFAMAFANKKSDVYLQSKDFTKAREQLDVAIKLAKDMGPTGKEMQDALQMKLDFLPKV